MNIDHCLNTTCTIQKRTITYNATTRQQTEAWADDTTGVRCRIDMASGGEKRLPKKIYERLTHLLFMGYRTGLNYKDYRIVQGGNTYNILLVTPAGGTTTHLELMLELVD
jgi:hypothetical protein